MALPPDIMHKALQEQRCQAQREYRHLRSERGWTRGQARTVVAYLYDYDDPEGAITFA